MCIRLCFALLVGAFLVCGSVRADTLDFTDSFGQDGSSTDLPTDIDEVLTVPGWAAVAPPNSVLTDVTVMLRASLTTEGNVTNLSTSSENATVLVYETDRDWVAVTSDLSGHDHTFGRVGDIFIDEKLGVLPPGEQVHFGPFMYQVGGEWITVFSGLGGGVESLSSISYRFLNSVRSYVGGGSNFGSSVRTASYGALRVIYTYYPTDVLIDLELDKLISPGPYHPGDRVTFTIRLWNRGPGTATGVAVEDRVPDGYEDIGNIDSGGTLSGRTITWENMTIPAGGHVDLSFQAVIRLEGEHENMAQVMDADQDDVDSTPGNSDPAEDDQDSVGGQLRIERVREVPAVSGWSMAVMSLLLGASAFRRFRRGQG